MVELDKVLGPDNLENLKKLAEQFHKQAPIAAPATGAPEGVAADDKVPELVACQTFEAADAERMSVLFDFDCELRNRRRQPAAAFIRD
ncbi:hypothetical protein A4A49_52354 [Nicotiana attenuata]|uniref:Uncharacterized protein n=1 Tax=Nicotiana attenuata TaxID=49451 RepID=A0A1J6IQY8_NICAT|nr:hypothetical protein A4A49_52354 [Nicotiana attenuata]